ncbi:hypothetical protein IWX90DRAFT_500099 [Phyllosticta citrichinensis]|uniref:Uncharacterized protein n=1 Tax=Phyllosticta citrichinensis TaxID=1130410 RepID=A0ABR1Y0R5_9PEZI
MAKLSQGSKKRALPGKYRSKAPNLGVVRPLLALFMLSLETFLASSICYSQKRSSRLILRGSLRILKGKCMFSGFPDSLAVGLWFKAAHSAECHGSGHKLDDNAVNNERPPEAVNTVNDSGAQAVITALASTSAISLPDTNTEAENHNAGFPTMSGTVSLPISCCSSNDSWESRMKDFPGWPQPPAKKPRLGAAVALPRARTNAYDPDSSDNGAVDLEVETSREHTQY